MTVVISSVGLVSPYGVGVDAAVEGMAALRVCASPREVAPGVSAMVAPVPPLSAELEALRAERRPAEAFLRGAVEQALAGGMKPDGFYFGTCSGEMQRFERWLPTGGADADDYAWYEAPAARVARSFGLPSPLTFTSACTSAFAAFAAGFHDVASGRVQRALVTGSDATCVFAASGFLTLKAASASAARPFSRSRSGLNFGEGAVAVVLERGDTGLARIHGVGLSGDAKHVTAPRPDGHGLTVAIERAVMGWDPRSIDVYVTHGTGTQANDAMELALGARMGWLERPWLAHKAFIGHAMGASGLMSLVIANEQLRRGVDARVPYEDLEPGAKLNAPLKGARRAVASAAAFGGSNAAVAWEIA